MGAKGSKQSPEHREKNRLSHLGIRHTPETRAKMSATRKGRKRTQAERDAISRGAKRREELNPTPKYLALGDTITKDVLFDLYIVKGMSTREAAKELGVSKFTVNRYLKWYEIPVRPSSKSPDFVYKADRSENYCRVAYDVHHIERKCVLCGTTERIHIHHMDGNRTNNSKDNLMPLCVSCHTYVHWRKWKGESFTIEPMSRGQINAQIFGEDHA